MSKEEYTMHWRCRNCGRSSPIGENHCPYCHADLALLGQQVFEGKEPPKPPVREFLIENEEEEIKKQTEAQKKEKRRKLLQRTGIALLVVAVLLLSAAVLQMNPRENAPELSTPTKPAPTTTEPPHQHTWDAGKLISNPSYTTEGEKRYTCTVCGASRSETLAVRTGQTISAGAHHTVGLKSDSNVVAVGDNKNGFDNYTGQCNVSGWKNIVAISAGWNHTVGLKADGTVVAVGSNIRGQCDVSGWKKIKLPAS